MQAAIAVLVAVIALAPWMGAPRTREVPPEVPLASPAARPPPRDLDEREYRTLTHTGRDLPDTEVAELERRVRADPNDVRSRVRLLGHYAYAFRDEHARAIRRPHVLWVIENLPESPIAGGYECHFDQHIDGYAYRVASERWHAHVAAQPQSARIAGNAAAFFLLGDRAYAIALLERAKALEPNVTSWSERLAQAYALGLSRKFGDEKREVARRAYREIKRAMEGARNRVHLLEDAGKLAFEAGELADAEALGNEMLAAIRTSSGKWNEGNLIHHGNLVLGRVALRNGRLKTAIDHLLAAGRTPGSPQLDSFGPNMTLAKELIEKGERRAVLEYFKLCARFWDMDRDRLKAWARVVEQGGKPDFGANLDY